MRLFRVMVPVRDIEAAASFYGRVLGLPGRRVSAGRHDFGCDGAMLSCIHAVAGDGGEVSRPNPGRICVATDDLNGTRRRLVGELGDRGVGPIEDHPCGERAVDAVDPWGNRLCFVDRATVCAGRRDEREV